MQSRVALKKILIASFSVLAVGNFPAAAIAQEKPWPTQTVKIIVPFAAGGVTDVLARILTERLGKALGQPFIAENRPGAGSTLGASIAATAKPDGYTFMLMSTSHLFAPVMYKNLPYDALTDFEPVARIVSSAFVMAINPQVPAKTVQEFIALSKSKPGEMNFGSSGNGGNQHLVASMYLQASKTDLKHVPYKGSSPVTVDLMGNQVQMAFMAINNALPQIKSGKLRALGVTSEKRMEELPTVPTMAEAGLPGFKATFWLALVAPKGTPSAIIQRVEQEILKVVEIPEVQRQLREGGLDVDIARTAQFKGGLKAESERWIALARSSNLSAE
ncbi:MAG: transporter [Polaromonas sp.]|nr:transporter [Polaromonas sp.]